MLRVKCLFRIRNFWILCPNGHIELPIPPRHIELPLTFKQEKVILPKIENDNNCVWCHVLCWTAKPKWFANASRLQKSSWCNLLEIHVQSFSIIFCFSSKYSQMAEALYKWYTICYNTMWLLIWFFSNQNRM